MQTSRDGVLKKFNVTITGQGAPLVLAHGFGCDQNTWRFLAPEFENDYQVIRYDLLGFGKSDLSAYDRERYSRLESHAEDLLEVLRALDVKDVIFIGHSVSSMIGALAAIREPARFKKLVMIGLSPRYINDIDYVGGFGRGDIDGLLAIIDVDFAAWAQAMSPTLMGNPERPELGAELAATLCRADPAIAQHFARTVFLSDSRAELPRVRVPTLILQCSDDVIAPVAVGEYVHKKIAGSRMVQLWATGHFPHLSAPAETLAAIRAFIE